MTSRKSILTLLLFVLVCLPFQLLSNQYPSGTEIVTDSVQANPIVEQQNAPSILSETGASVYDPSFEQAIAEEDWINIEDVSPELSQEGRIPLILVHGWSFNGKPAPPGTGYWDFFKNYLMNDPELKKYFKPYYVKYWSNAVSVNQLGSLLRNEIEQAGLHELPLVIIGHSMGGLVSRSFMNENVYTTGINAGKKCGDIVKLLITLGTPHHGSPMANGPARDDKVNFLMKLTMSTVESMVFSDTRYYDVNRSDLRWDNFNKLLNYEKYPGEKNDWLTNLNTMTNYDPKLICYSSTVTGAFLLPPYSNVDEQYKVGSYLLKESFNVNNDGIVPIHSSSFLEHTPKKIRFFSEYNHTDIVRGKGDGSELFGALKEDLLGIIPPQILWPSVTGTYLKHSQIRTISWDAPSSTAKVNIYFSEDNGINYSLLANNVDANTEAFQWSVPDTNLTQCLIKVTNASNEELSTCSANTFTIYHNRLSIISPPVKTYFAPNKSNPVSWNQSGVSPSVRLTYFDPKNNVKKVITEEFPVNQSLNTYDWATDHSIPPTDSAYITIELLKMNELYGDEEKYLYKTPAFMMLGEPEITITAPSAFPLDEFGISGERMFIDSLYTVKWQTEGEIKFVKISLCDSLKNPILEVRKKNHQPGIHSNGSTNWKIPEMYGDTYYLLIEAGTSQNTITTSGYTAHPFRINRSISIANPINGDKEVSLLPCLEMDSIPKATGYIFEISDSATHGSDYFLSFNSPSPALCLPKNVENELIPGVSYNLTSYAMFGLVKSYASRVKFQAMKQQPFPFQTLLPLMGDTIEGISLTFGWNRAIGAQEYQVEIINQGNLLSSKLFSRTDTMVSISIGRSGRTDTINWKVTARNEYGESFTENYFFKRNRTGLDRTELNPEENFKLINYPNPFETETTIEYFLPVSNKTYQVEMTIYNLSGQKIKTLTKTDKTSGFQKVTWDGKDESGIRIEKGIYFGCLTVNQKSVTHSIIVK